MLKSLFEKIFGHDEKHPLEEKPQYPADDIKEVSERKWSDAAALDKNEYFTQRSRRILKKAQEIAEELHHSSIRTEHLLLSLLSDEESIAGRVLRDLGPQPETTQKVILEMVTDTNSDTISSELPAETKQVLELAVDEARHMGKVYIGTEHLLLGLTRQNATTASRALNRLGLTPNKIRNKVRQILQSAR